jgi:Asp-tRNA(Asn)/Glu-tRNA(Gln) amidotransferase C subunit
VLLRLLLLAELNNIIRNKDDEITDLKNLVYCRSDDTEKLIQALQDVDVQLVECMTQIKEMAAAKEQNKKELEELKGAAQVVVDMMDPSEQGVVSNKTMLEQLRKTLQKILGYVSETTKIYVEHILELVKSYCPKANLEPLANGSLLTAPKTSSRNLLKR